MENKYCPEDQEKVIDNNKISYELSVDPFSEESIRRKFEKGIDITTNVLFYKIHVERDHTYGRYMKYLIE